MRTVIRLNNSIMVRPGSAENQYYFEVSFF